MTPEATAPDYRPRFPTASRYGVGILGCGQIAQTAHLPAYGKYDLDVVGVWSRTAATTADVQDRFPLVKRVYQSAEDLLADPAVDIVDIATPPEQRLGWMEQAVAAGKHVLAQKPLAVAADEVLPVLDEAERRGLWIAVNQNGRWAPVWRLATLLVEAGRIGEVVGVTHLHDKPLPPIAGSRFDDIPHMLVADYLVHWLDITRCWLEGKRADSVAARDHRTPGQPSEAKNPWSATVQMGCVDGAAALVHIVGDVRTRQKSCPFWIHGTEGTIRGSILGKDFLELERDGRSMTFPLEGEWFVDGFAGAMGELMCAVEEGRAPYNSARHNLATLRLVAAAVSSATEDGRPQRLDLAL